MLTAVFKKRDVQLIVATVPFSSRDPIAFVGAAS